MQISKIDKIANVYQKHTFDVNKSAILASNKEEI